MNRNALSVRDENETICGLSQLEGLQLTIELEVVLVLY